MFMFPMILIRETMAASKRLEEGVFSTRSPSTRYLILTSFSKGSIWISLARSSIASRMIRLTRLTSEGSFASFCSSAAE